jgi:hypothetical protein
MLPIYFILKHETLIEFPEILQINVSCTFGAWHPLAAEKLATIYLNSADDFSVYQSGVVNIIPFHDQCKSQFE